ncbi:MAG TPA: beta-galactosidase, partial [Candidatus Sulfotelmatobacter sp.]|nr:beta-galactosidase [Candidatus Sulfotelmatobacter sp.]
MSNSRRPPAFLPLLAFWAAGALCFAAACAAETPFGTNLFFGITMSPTSPLSASQLDQLDQAGNNWVDIQFAWSSFEPSQGQYSSTYVRQIQTAIDNALSRGWKAGLRLSWQYPPSWATQLPEARFVNQYGDLFSDTGSSGKNVVAFPFNQNLRNIISLTMANFFAQMQTNAGGNYLQKLSAIAFGGGFYGEVNLPDPVFNGHANCYWAYSNEAKSMFQAYLAGHYGTIGALNSAWGRSYDSFAAAGFTPGQTSLSHRAAVDFLNWLCSVQQQYVLFQRNLIRNAYDGYIMLELGGWGLRTNYITSNLTVDLNGSGAGADSVSKVYDFGNFLRVLSEAGESKVLANCTWIDPSLSFSGPGNPAPVEWIAGFARQYGFLSCGEYTANSTALDLGAARVNDSGLVLAFYVPASRLFAGSYPTVADWGNMIGRSQRAFAASVPYLLSYDIGSVGTAGSDTIAPEAISSSGAGTGYRVGAAADSFHYLAAILEGDGELVLKVNSMSADSAAQTGLMVRQGLGTGDYYTAVMLGSN